LFKILHLPTCNNNINILARFEVLLEDCKTLSLLSVVCNDSAGASDDLAGFSFFVNLAKTGPLSKLLVLWDSDQIDSLLGTKSLNELFVIWLIAIVSQHTELSLSTLNCTRSLVKATRKAIVGESLLQNHLNGSVDVHSLSWGGRSLLHRFWAIPSVRHFGP
jgi:hypothetical protein